MKAAIAVDDWKLTIYKDALLAADYEYDDCGELTKGVVILKVETDDPAALKAVLDEAETKAQASRQTMH